MKNKDLRLTVCVVAYNHEKYIAQALDSFLMQKTDFAFQVIVGDDASTDRTPEILREYARKYPDIIKPILRNKNVGPINNSLDVYDHAKTEYVAICDGDDYWTDENKLQMQVDFLDKNRDYSICYHNTKVRFNDNSSKDIIWPPEAYRFNKTVLSLEELAIRNPMHTNSIVYRWRFCDDSIRDFMPDNICPGDYFLALLHAEKGYVGFIDKVMSVYRRHDGGMSADVNRSEDKTWLKYGIEELNFHKAVENHFRYRLARYMRNEKIKKCVKVLKAYFNTNAYDKIEYYKQNYPEYYELAKENFYNPEYNSDAWIFSGILERLQRDVSALNKKIRKNKKRIRLLGCVSFLIFLVVSFLLYELFKGYAG